MILRDLQARQEALRNAQKACEGRSADQWASDLYLRFRWEFETTTVCENGRVRWVRGRPIL